MERECESCGKTFETTNKRKRFCGPTCRSRKHRSPAKQGRAAAAGKAAAEAQVPALGGLVSATAAELTELDALDSVRGRAALALAYRIESPMETGAAAASMTVQLTRLMDEVRAAAAPKTRDGLDALQEGIGGKLRLVT